VLPTCRWASSWWD